MIKYKKCKIDVLVEELTEFIVDVFKTRFENISLLHNYTNMMQKDIICLMEYPYVDKLYRDTYYNYFSSKHKKYQRDCIRILFIKEIPNKNHGNVYGFIVIRPLPTNPIGRTMISPIALKEKEFICCLVSIKIFFNNKYFFINGFPHTRQDGHTHSCAETTIWSILEYFSFKYSNYSPILPSRIIKLLDEQIPRRMLPSRGLDINSISFAIKRFGFATMIYSNKIEKNFKKLMYYYIESGIPIIVAISTDRFNHAVIYIGHMNQDPLKITNLQPEPDTLIIETADLYDTYIVIDDNYPPYQKATFEKPGLYYQDIERKKYQITHFIVPLYPKVYLDAIHARELISRVIYHENIGYIKNDFKKEDIVVLRFFLTSANSFKNFINAQKNVTNYCKLDKIILNQQMPKFIWVAELSTKSLYRNGSTNGLILIDATGDDSLLSILFTYYPKKLLNIQKMSLIEYESVIFPMYKNNLKGEWNEWKI